MVVEDKGNGLDGDGLPTKPGVYLVAGHHRSTVEVVERSGKGLFVSSEDMFSSGEVPEYPCLSVKELGIRFLRWLYPETDLVCGLVPPREDEMVDCGSEHRGFFYPSCVLRVPHYGPHVIVSKEGKFIAFEDDDECGCCIPGDPDQCYTHWSIDETEFDRLLEDKS